MTDRDAHLGAILARIDALLSLAEKRTPGEWNGVESEGDYFGDTLIGLGSTYEGWQDDVAFVTSCAGAAEAGWRATREAIVALRKVGQRIGANTIAYDVATRALDAIRAQWPEEML